MARSASSSAWPDVLGTNVTLAPEEDSPETPREPWPEGARPHTIETDVEGDQRRGIMRVQPPTFQAPGSDVIFVDERTGPQFIGALGATITFAVLEVPPARQLRVTGLSLVDDEPAVAGLVAFTLLKNGNPISGFINMPACGSLSEPRPVWLNVIGPATVSVMVVSNAPLGQGTNVTARIVGYFYVELEHGSRPAN